MITFRGDFTQDEKDFITRMLPDNWIATKNHLGFWIRSPEFNWDEVLAGDTLEELQKRFSEYESSNNPHFNLERID